MSGVTLRKIASSILGFVLAPLVALKNGLSRVDGFEFNKLAASVLIAGLAAVIIGKIGGALYHPEIPETRGYQIEVAEETPGGAVKEKEVIKIGQLMAAASAERGQKVAKKCLACHTFDKGGANKVGPNLWGVLGNQMAQNAGFAYSPALSGMSQGWDYNNLYAFLNNPKKFMKGTKMAFVGLRKPQDIADMIAYMHQQSDTQYPLPPVEE